jgi:hypothetical protein
MKAQLLLFIFYLIMRQHARMQKGKRQMPTKLEPVEFHGVMTLEDVLAFLRYADEMREILKKALTHSEEVPSFFRRVTDIDLSC